MPACGSGAETSLDGGAAGKGGADSETGSSGAAGSTAAAGAAGAGTQPAGVNEGSAGAGGAAGACQQISETHPPASASHLAMCSDIPYDSNPPSGGDHYGVWAEYRSYDFPVPDGFLVHCLEHGAVVFWYNCPDGCADEVAQAQAMIDALPLDPLCAGLGTPRRTVLVPSPALDARWAASSWGFLQKADCFDADALRSFYLEHSGQGRESLCDANGVSLTPTTCP
ncbi:MAG TPA: DUF3105 domain-containing protein [Polyangiaceae bacterium]|nr:DUF3105 domain-containing protein [Polyangiaceae bacterium]